MNANISKRAAGLACATLLALTACSSGKGDQGPQGNPGEPGVSTGTITGTLQVTGGAPVPNATVAITTPGVSLGISAQTLANGTFTLQNVPIGTHTLTVSGTGVTQTTFTNIVVVAQTTTDIGVKTIAYSPMTISFAAVPSPAGFGKAIPLSATVAGAPGAITYAWTVSGPTAAGLSSTTVANPTFTTPTFQELVDSGVVKFLKVPNRAGVINMSAQQQTYATCTLHLTVTSGGYTQSKDLAISPAGWIQGKTNVGVGTMVIANDAPAGSYAWTLTKPTGATAASDLQAATTRNPWFIPDVAGDWVLTNGATSVTVKADMFVGVTPTCGLCHGSLPAARQAKITAIWTEYGSSAHGNYYFEDPAKAAKGLFAAGIDGELAFYSPVCVKCHTTGNDPTATNGGFDETGFTFPTTLQAGNFAALTATQKELGAITCESCHGPITSHSNTGANPPKAFFNAEACAMCHDALSHHDRYQLWSQAGHADPTLALEEATTENRGTTAAHCGRCHSAQGFARWSEQLNAAIPNSGNITKPDGTAADLPYLNSLGLNNANVEPQTCQACHDPHTTKLRIDGSKPTPLPAGFSVSGSGAGQLCMSCHNTRNNLHDDAHAPTSYSAPHVASQTDVYFGMNAYFLGVGAGADFTSRHTAVSETCVGCHMAKEGADPTLFLQPQTSNHSWRVGEEICANCHGAGVNGEALKAHVELALSDVAAAGAVALRALVAPVFTADASFLVRAWNSATDLYSSTLSSTSNVSVAELPAATSIAWEEIHGQIGVKMTLATPINVTWTDSTTTSVTELRFQLGSLKTNAGTAIVPVGGNIVKGMWNYFLVHSDGSRGIHNPTFVNQLLAATRANIAL